MVIEGRPSRYLRVSNTLAFCFGACAAGAVFLSVFVMASRPWSCSASSASSVVTCDWSTSRLIASVWLVGALSVCVIAWKRWKLPLAIISVPLLAVGLISVVGVFTLATAALWLACALWLWARDRRWSIVVAALASILLLGLAANGVRGLLALHSTPI
jgi:hypothetical protein